ncbi:MAG: hypothetical protein Q9157_008611, partial [Trypethelium eluteriae]
MEGEDQSARRQTPSRALENIGYNSIITDLEGASTSDDEPNASQKFPPEDAQSVIGFSIGYEQTRLASPQTPAVEKAAVLESGDGFFDNLGAIADNVTTEEAEEIEVHDSNRAGGTSVDDLYRQPEQRFRSEKSEQEGSSAHRLPSPWRATARTFQGTDNFKTPLKGANEEGRRKPSAGPLEAATDSLKRFLPSLPSLPKSPGFFNFSLPSLPNPLGTGHVPEGEQQTTRPSDHVRRHSLPTQHAMPEGSSSSQGETSTTDIRQQNRDNSINDSNSGVAPSRHIQIAEPGGQKLQRQTTGDRLSSSQIRNPLLRRVTSDESLRLQRSISRVSSLGDDSRFENVSEQVNSRLRAIKDSWQDSNIRLPNISISNFGFGSFRQDGSPLPPTGNLANNSTPRIYRPKSLSLSSSTHLKRALDNSLGSTSSKTTPEPPKSGGGMSSGSAASHPCFTRALEELEGDLVILGGYRGSVLRSAEPPNRQLWVPIKVGLNLRKVDLQVGLEPEDEENMEERIIPGGMLNHIGPVDMSRRLFKRLRASENARKGKLRIWDYGYDWRLSPHLLSRKLVQYLGKLPSNQSNVPKEKRGAIVIAHSLGGLITRHAINQHPDLFSGVVYAGVPTTCINILGPLRNGDDVLFSSKVLTAQVNFTIRTSYALLPLDGRCFIDKHTKEEYPVDFFDVQTWIDNCLTPVLAPPLPPLAPASNGPIEGLLGSMSNALASVSLPLRKGSVSRHRSPRNSVSDLASRSKPATTSDSTAIQHRRSSSDHLHTSDRNANATAHTS